MTKKPTASFSQTRRVGSTSGGPSSKEGASPQKSAAASALTQRTKKYPLSKPGTRRVLWVSKPVLDAPADLEIVAEYPPVHPGTILREEFLRELGLTAYAVAKACQMPRSKLERIVRGELGISGDTAVRLGRFFNMSDRFWMNLQATYEVMKARQAIGPALEEIKPLDRAQA